jgi:enamine deaminase RidA (YjgF/YER057c/UK114 family)
MKVPEEYAPEADSEERLQQGGMMQRIEDSISSVIQRPSRTISFHVTDGEDRTFIVASVKSPAEPREAASLSYSQIAELLSERGMAIVHERIFGSLSVEHDVMSARRQAFTSFGISPENPVTYIEGTPPWGKGLAGVIIHAVKADEVWTIMDSGVPCGRGGRLNGVTHLVLQNIQAMSSIHCTSRETKHHPPFNPLPSPHSCGFAEAKRKGTEYILPHPCPLPQGEREPLSNLFSMSKSSQTRLMLERAERILRENGASYKDVARTWFYLSDILGWYATFNKVRNEKYGEFGIMPGPGDRELLLPASTGIQGETPTGAACSMDLIAVLDSQNCTRKLSNPSQLDAFRYGSAFARASVVRNGSTNLIEVSGTAAIDEHGVSLYPADIHAQIDCTFDKVQALLEQEGAGLQDICAATVFVKQPEFAEIFYEMAAARGLENFPCVCIVADVCREDLLFEIDAEAVVKTGGARGRGVEDSSE